MNKYKFNPENFGFKKIGNGFYESTNHTLQIRIRNKFMIWDNRSSTDVFFGKISSDKFAKELLKNLDINHLI